MNQIDILLPFGLPPEDLAKDLLRQCKSPALATLLARAKVLHTEELDPFSRALPHETWLAKKFLSPGFEPETSPPIAGAQLRQHGLQADSGTWFIVQPVHFHIARDHLVLTDPRQLNLPDEESRILFEAARPLFEEAGKTLVYGDAATWFVQADDWHGLRTATPDAACGHNIDIWMPKGDAELAWRKLQNEVQMHWHMHELNAQREARGAKMVNSLWLWGGSTVSHGAQASKTAPYSETFNLRGWTAALGAASTKDNSDCYAIDTILAQPRQGLVMIDALLTSSLASDWGSWLQIMEMLDTEWFTLYVSALQGGRLQRVNLILTNNTRLAEFSVSRNSLRKFWVKPNLNRLLP
ncbi:hypothetical protein [Paucimonas lemoignei]|nr:hypothetical protein [Paucimonas lemoignei]